MVQKVKTISSNVRYDNRNDESRTFDMEVNARVSGYNVNGMDEGRVMQGETILANFNWWQENSLSITYENLDTEAQRDVNEAVNVFVAEVREASVTQNEN